MEHNVQFQFQARYYKSAPITNQTRQVWFVLHGYGQLAQYFIRKFSVLSEHNIVVIAPEGLSRFYIEPIEGTGRKSNRVGASWMTKENRETDIANYMEYLNTVYQRELNGVPVPKTLLGFSQGSATASRWMLSDMVDFDRLILWSGIFPPDINFGSGRQIFARKEVRLVYGTRDPFLTDERFVEMDMISKKLGTEVNPLTFDGAHDINEGALLQLI